MQCGKCRSEIDDDAVFCTNCGTLLTARPETEAQQRNRGWWYLLLLLPVLILAGGLGYYKFALPQGVAAVVNGENITLAELDATMRGYESGQTLSDESRAQMRYAVLSQLISERIAAQEARKAGFTASDDEVDAAVERMRAASRMDEQSFAAQVRLRYGDRDALRRSLRRQLTIGKYVDAKVLAGAPDAASASARMDRWLRNISGQAAVRVALSEELQTGSCGCCGGRSAAARPGCDASHGPAQASGILSPQARDAQSAALAYWNVRHGAEPVETRVRDFGCHIEVDILQHDRIAQSLRYQNGRITEM
jgi:hypothetical protein